MNINNKTMELKVKKINVAPSSNDGHFVEKSKQVIDLDVINETFIVETDKDTTLTSKNHTNLKIEKDCIITCQVVYNPFLKVFEKSKD